MVCVCWLVRSTLDDNVCIDKVNPDALCPSVIVDGENREETVVDNVVSAVDTLSVVEYSNVDVLIGVIAVVNTDIASVLSSDSVVEVN